MLFKRKLENLGTSGCVALNLCRQSNAEKFYEAFVTHMLAKLFANSQKKKAQERFRV